MKKKWMAVSSALFLAALTGLSGCGSGKSAASLTMAESADDMMSYEAAMDSGTMETNAAYAKESGVSGASSITAPQAAGRKLIRNVRLSVETESFDDLLPVLEAQIAELSGYVEQSEISGSSMTRQNTRSSRYASITARIPSTSLDQFITEVESNGNVTYKSESTNDVTLQYSDLESRKKSLTIEQERIWALLEQADTLESVIALEERLSEIRYELESMESQLRLYDNQVDYSTVYMDVYEVTVYTPTAPESVGERIRNGFSQNAERMGDFLTNSLILVLSASPIWLPLLILACLIVWIVKRDSFRIRTAGKAKKKEETDSDNKSNNE